MTNCLNYIHFLYGFCMLCLCIIGTHILCVSFVFFFRLCSGLFCSFPFLFFVDASFRSLFTFDVNFTIYMWSRYRTEMEQKNIVHDWHDDHAFRLAGMKHWQNKVLLEWNERMRWWIKWNTDTNTLTAFAIVKGILIEIFEQMRIYR